MGSTVADDAGTKTEPVDVPDKAATGQRVMLRVEVASKGQARLITYSVILLNLVFIMLSIGLLSGEGAFGTLGDFRPLYRAQLVLASICLGLLLIMLLRLGLSFRRSKVERRVWSKRQTYFFRTAAVLAALVTCYTTFYVAALADTLAQPNCGYPWMPLAALEFLRRFTFAAIILFLLIRVHNMKLWRGAGALDMDPNYRLLVDRPFRDKARSHIIVLVIWGVMIAMAALNLYSRVAQYNRGARDQFGVGCGLEVDALLCKATAVSKAAAIVSFVAMLTFQLVWVLMLRRALLDHKQLPYCRYKDTSIFIRIQARIVGPVLVAVLLTMLTLELVPALRGSCMGPVTAQMGNLPLQLSLTLASTIIAILYTPVPSDAHSPLQNELLQQFAWTAAEVPRVLEQRAARLAAAEAASKLGDQDDSLLAQLENVHAQLADQLGRLAHAQGGASAAEQLRAEPVFCLETALRLFYWARLAYRNEEKLDYKWVNEAGGRALFGLDHAEALWDEDTDTHAVLGWSGSAVVVAFRGTSSLQNTMTDLKSWRVPLVPRRRHEGRLVTVHAGFQKAWLHNDFNKKVLAKLAEISKGAAKPLRIWVTGHSLGGALAVLASLEIHEQHPDSQMTTVTFGCPRVGNTAYAAAYDAAVPDTWSVVNGTDPVAWIPKVGFKRVGKRVNIDGLGNLLVRPSYFELSVVQRGTNPKHHMTGAYALSMATIVKNQFSATRSIPGGDGGAAELAMGLDLGSVLVLTRMGLEALRDPSLPPQSCEKLEREALEAARKPSGAVAVECGCGGRWRRRRQATPLVADEAETEMEKAEPAKAEP